MGGTDTRLTLAVCAFNEEANIGGLLETLLAEAPAAGSEILIVSSGSTDRTDEIVRSYSAEDPRVRLVVEPARRGKVAAVNVALAESDSEIVILADADCLPGPEAVATIVALLDDPRTGGVGTRNVAVNAGESMVAAAASAMWELHHLVNLETPVLGGDIVAFRRVFGGLPTDSGINDDFLIEQELRRRNYEIAYAERALTFMRVPTGVADFIAQRRRIHYGFWRQKEADGATKATQRPLSVVGAAWKLVRRRPSRVGSIALLAVLDTWARLLGYVDAARRKTDHIAWTPALSTKGPLIREDQSKAGD